MHCWYGDGCPYRTYMYIMKIQRLKEKFKDTKKVSRYPPFGIGIGTDIVFGISVPESTTVSTEIPEYRISFGIHSSAFFQIHYTYYLSNCASSGSASFGDTTEFNGWSYRLPIFPLKSYKEKKTLDPSLHGTPQRYYRGRLLLPQLRFASDSIS